jgi:hypothetical protein
MILARIILLFALSAGSVVFALPGDLDGDELSDAFEQKLLETFAPQFMVGIADCDGLPAEFHPGKTKPQLLEKNGTIYGRVAKVVRPGIPGNYIEIHYYHLWNQDCGRNGHALDAEHVSALLSSEVASESVTAWKAEYWYAAAHEDTVCDASHAVRSSVIEGELRGPTVWISSGKHASFLNRELCRGGCGGDDCGAMRPLISPKLINLGERGRPMNGSLWINWPGWSLAEKMQSDFPEPVIAQINAAERSAPIPVNESQASVKTAVLIAGSTAGALESADRKADTVVSTTGGALGRSLNKSATGTGNSLKRAGQAFWKAMGHLVPDKDK